MAAADELAAVLRGGSRRALARAVTLVESTRPDHRAEAERLIEVILPAPFELIHRLVRLPLMQKLPRGVEDEVEVRPLPACRS